MRIVWPFIFCYYNTYNRMSKLYQVLSKFQISLPWMSIFLSDSMQRKQEYYKKKSIPQEMFARCVVLTKYGDTIHTRTRLSYLFWKNSCPLAAGVSKQWECNTKSKNDNVGFLLLLFFTLCDIIFLMKLGKFLIKPSYCHILW